MTIEPKRMSEEELALVRDEWRNWPTIARLLGHVVALKRDLEWERNEHQRSVDTMELVLGEAERTATEQIAEWLDSWHQDELAEQIRSGAWRPK